MEASAVTTALADVSTVFSQAVSMITSNGVAMAFVGISLVGGGISLFRRIVHR